MNAPSLMLQVVKIMLIRVEYIHAIIVASIIQTLRIAFFIGGLMHIHFILLLYILMTIKPQQVSQLVDKVLIRVL
jgi:hypothetical protein